MILIALSVLCSLSVFIILKLTARYHWDARQIIGGGYLVAAGLCGWLLSPNPHTLFTSSNTEAWILFLALGILLPSLFIAIAKSVEQVGIVLTDATQRLALLLPLLAAFLWFNEPFTWMKGLGLSLGLFAMLCIIWRDEHQPSSQWYWPLIVFCGMGFIDILFKQMALLSQLAFADILFAVFLLAFFLCSLYLSVLFIQGKARWQWPNLVAAIALGSFNFGNILFYIKAHQALASQPALVFASMNIGVIAAGALMGLIVFKETLNRLNLLGIGLAILAVALLALA